MAQRGGKRAGAGRPKGAKDRLTREAGATLSELARQHTESALNALVYIATQGESETARVSAANALLDRGYGKAPQQLEHTGKDGKDLPVSAPAIAIFALPDNGRDFEAQK